MVKKLLFPILFVCTLLSCKNESKNLHTYLGGQIVNPISDKLVLLHTDMSSDTIAVDENGFFEFKIDQVAPGLHIFKHGEYQYVYLEKGDSIVLRVNTRDFEESLAFSGNGSQKNNFLIASSLNSDKYNKKLIELFKLSPEDFDTEILKLKKSQQKELDLLKKEKAISKGFTEVARSLIDQDYYNKKELYATEKHIDGTFDETNFPKDFFKHRKSINFNNLELSIYRYNYRLLNSYLDNLVFEKSDISEKDINSYAFTKEKLNLIDSLVTIDHTHNYMLKSLMKKFLTASNNNENEAEILKRFYKSITNNVYKSEITEFATRTEKLNKGNSLPNVKLVSLENVTVDIKDIIKKKTVFFFWSKNSVRLYNDIHNRVNELRSKYPEYQFIGINTDDHFKKWKNTVLSARYDKKFEFQFENAESATKTLNVDRANKAIIVDSNNAILESNSNIFNKEIETLLLGFLND